MQKSFTILHVLLGLVVGIFIGVVIGGKGLSLFNLTAEVGGGERCGDGICNGVESSNTCSGDCGAPDPGTENGACHFPDGSCTDPVNTGTDVNASGCSSQDPNATFSAGEDCEGNPLDGEIEEGEGDGNGGEEGEEENGEDGGGNQDPMVACCIGDECSQVPAPNCVGIGDTSIDASCDPNPCKRGACCTPLGGCMEWRLGECETQGFEFHEGGSCPSSCEDGSTDMGPPSVGVCCLFPGGCDQLNEQECISQGGAFQGDSTTCDAAGCLPAGYTGPADEGGSSEE